MRDLRGDEGTGRWPIFFLRPWSSWVGRLSSLYRALFEGVFDALGRARDAAPAGCSEAQAAAQARGVALDGVLGVRRDEEQLAQLARELAVVLEVGRIGLEVRAQRDAEGVRGVEPARDEQQERQHGQRAGPQARKAARRGRIGRLVAAEEFEREAAGQVEEAHADLHAVEDVLAHGREPAAPELEQLLDQHARRTEEDRVAEQERAHDREQDSQARPVRNARVDGGHVPAHTLGAGPMRLQGAWCRSRSESLESRAHERIRDRERAPHGGPGAPGGGRAGGARAGVAVRAHPGQFQVLARLEVPRTEERADPLRPADQRRADDPRPCFTVEEVLRQAPARVGDFYRVPKTVGGEE